ncbi:MAG: RecQ family ATP-dependent DNA helicase [Ignavibacteria bacterium]|nr:RecQ family ATP-dependent DNA helicase [Ignavibacteria bacterium]
MTSNEILINFFGYDHFRPGQEEIINSILSGESVLAVLPTGGGKSICYQVPALMSNRFSIVISPLIALMKDQVDSINSKKKVAAFINSTIDFRETNKILSEIDLGNIKLLYLSPEKLSNIHFCESIKNLKPSFLFVDEAHCISEWGHSFRPNYRKIKSFADLIGINSISAFTATATVDVRDDIINQLGMVNPKIFIKGFERENLHLNVINTKNKKEKVLELIKHNELPGIIYTATRKSSEEISDYLRLQGIEAIYYHAGVTSELRRIIQDDFQKNRVKLIVATNAFGMGIDKSDIKTLIHFQLPANLENYYQEIGRAGRDGNEAKIFLLYDDNDHLIQEYFIRNLFPTREQIELVYNTLCDYSSIALGSALTKEIPIDNNITSFLESKGVTKGLLESSIKILSDSGYISPNSDNKKHFVQSLFNPKYLLNYIKNIDDNDVKDLLLILAREYGTTFFNSRTYINISRLSQLLDESNEHIVDLLKSLSNLGIINYQPPSIHNTIRLVGTRIKGEDLKLNYEKTKNLIDYSRIKLDMMMKYVSTNQCRFKFILEYFGQIDENYKCGKCDICTGKQIYSNNTEFIEQHLIELLKGIVHPIKKIELINILKGKSIEGNNLPGFGSCSHFSKKEIESVIHKLQKEQKVYVRKNEIKLFIADDNPSATRIKSNMDFEVELQLFNMLRQIRKEASSKFNQSPQLICPDELLQKIARSKPATISELLAIEGFNQRMYNKIGEEFLEVLKESRSDSNLKEMISKKNLPENSLQVVELLRKKYSLEDISKLTKLSETLLSIQIESLISAVPDLDVSYLFNVDDLREIEKKISEGITDLKDLKEALNNRVNYSLLRIYLAKKKISQ